MQNERFCQDFVKVGRRPKAAEPLYYTTVLHVLNSLVLSTLLTLEGQRSIYLSMTLTSNLSVLYYVYYVSESGVTYLSTPAHIM
jgi:hypothetical protein